MAPREQTVTALANDDAAATSTKRILIVGAGPAGLLAAINLLRRNENLDDVPNKPRYQVTLVDPGVDYGKLDEDGLSRFRSWMIGLSAHGLSAVKEIPGLYEDHITKVGVQVREATFGIGSSMNFSSKADEGGFDGIDGFCVDRNYVCAALARYLNENFGNSKSPANGAKDFITYYNTKALFVDGEKKRVMVRANGMESPLQDHEEMTGLEYDILLGCDGIRSVTRNSFLTNHRDFEFDLQGDFGTGKSIHVTRPKNISEGHFMLLFNCLPNVVAFVLPERGDQLNFGIGWSINKPPPTDELFSDDPKIIAAYLKENFKAGPFKNAPPEFFDEFGEQWAKQRMADGQFVHCNFYHSTKLQALLMGDAAHATVPNIGQGMNTALDDASALNKLLDEHEDNWEEVLPAFSKLRVKEGYALSELSYHTFSLDPGMQMNIMIRQNIHKMFNKILPEWLLEKEPMSQIPAGMNLSVAYDKMVQYGYLAKSRQINNDIKRAHFERESGMVTHTPSRGWSAMKLLGLSAVVAGISYAVGAKGISFK